MEDTARLAVLEQSIRDENMFIKTLRLLLDFIVNILEYPHDRNYTSIKFDKFRDISGFDTFIAYLKYVGFEVNAKEISFPKGKSLNKLMVTREAIQRKLWFTTGSKNKLDNRNQMIIKSELRPVKVLTTSNEFLLKIEDIFNQVLQYEDESLLLEARDVIPLIPLETKAIDRMKDHQKKMKDGEVKGPDMSFKMAQLMELIGWFKHSFFKWVDKPICDKCGTITKLLRTQTKQVVTEICRVEFYKCPSCGVDCMFPRFNNPRTLLSTRRGRCGEWANCFALLCRSLGYDTRYVYDTTDHVWCEVYDNNTSKWIHVDPSEGLLDAPLVYEHGWKKKLAYIIGFSRDDVQDVTWRYSSHHKELLKRRKLCSEKELIDNILLLREARQKQVSSGRRQHLLQRCLLELAQIMNERQPSEYEGSGRVSGGHQWRRVRGELGECSTHTFILESVGKYAIEYYPTRDEYVVTMDNAKHSSIKCWSKGLFKCKNVFRKEETDWQMVYLAREEDAPVGQISWKVSADGDNIMLTSLAIQASSKLYENGQIKWTLQFDAEKPLEVQLGETSATFQNTFKVLIITAELSGGKGDLAWQHSQLFRQSMDVKSCALQIVTVAKNIDC